MLMMRLPRSSMKCGCIHGYSRHASRVASGRMNRVPPAISISTIRETATPPTSHRFTNPLTLDIAVPASFPA